MLVFLFKFLIYSSDCPTRIFGHRWSAWSDPVRVDNLVPVGNFGDAKIGSRIIQTRVCDVCGFVDSRTVFEGGYSDAGK